MLQSCASSVAAELYTPGSLKRGGAAVRPRTRGFTSTPLNCSVDNAKLASGPWSQPISAPALDASSILSWETQKPTTATLSHRWGN